MLINLLYDVKTIPVIVQKFRTNKMFLARKKQQREATVAHNECAFCMLL